MIDIDDADIWRHYNAIFLPLFLRQTSADEDILRDRQAGASFPRFDVILQASSYDSIFPAVAKPPKYFADAGLAPARIVADFASGILARQQPDGAAA